MQYEPRTITFKDKKILQKKNTLISFFLLLMLISGCGIIPMPVSVFHTAADFILHEETGKTSGEHVLSEVTEKDCKFIRFIDTNQICMSNTEYEEYLLSLNCDTYIWDIMGRVKCKKVLDKL